jgi:hypothetical protein
MVGASLVWRGGVCGVGELLHPLHQHGRSVLRDDVSEALMIGVAVGCLCGAVIHRLLGRLMLR